MKFEKVRMHFKSGVFGSLPYRNFATMTTAFPLYFPRQSLEGDYFYLRMKVKR